MCDDRGPLSRAAVARLAVAVGAAAAAVAAFYHVNYSVSGVTYGFFGGSH